MNKSSTPSIAASTNSAMSKTDPLYAAPIDWTAALDQLGRVTLRYSLVVVISWIGLMKFTAYEAQAISGLVANSPLMSWTYDLMTQRQFAAGLGIVELLIAAFIAANTLAPRLATLGAAAAVGMFATTLSFMATTPATFEPSAGGFPALSAMPGQFLLKDTVLLATAITLLARSFKTSNAGKEI